MKRLHSKQRSRRTNARNHPVENISANTKAGSPAAVGLYGGKKEASLGLSQLRIPAKKTPYMLRKDIEMTHGVYTDISQEITYIPAFDINGDTKLYQAIFPDGRKYYVGTGTLEGHFHVIGGFDELNHANRFVICEDYATGYVLHTMLSEAKTDDSLCVVVAFGAINLASVSKAIRRKYPAASIVIAGDDDRHTVMTYGVNIGRDSAEAAAKAVGGVAVFPEFDLREKSYLSELPPFTPEIYKKYQMMVADLENSRSTYGYSESSCKSTIVDQLHKLEQMKGSTNYYDLYRKSLNLSQLEMKLYSKIIEILSC